MLVPVFETLMARYNLSLSMLRSLMTVDNIKRVELDYKDVYDALNYIDRKRRQTQPTPRPQGTSYNSSTMWSPVSNAGVE